MKTFINNIIAQFNLYTFLVFVAAFMFLLILIYPKGREIYYNKVQLEQKKLRLNNAEAAIAELPAISRDLLKVIGLVEGEMSLLVKPEQVGEILVMIDLSVKKSKASLISVTSRNDQLSEVYSFGANCQFQLLPVEIQLKGDYVQIAGFIEALTNSKKLLLFEQAVIENKNDNSSMLSGSLKVDFFLKASSAKKTETKEGAEHV